MQIRYQIAAVFLAVGLGALTVTLLYAPNALLPHPPIGSWLIERLLVLASLAALASAIFIAVPALVDWLDRVIA